MAEPDIRLVFGFDFGTRSIGVAVGQMITGQARELCNLKAENGIPKWEEIEKLIKEWKPDVLIVGKPLNMDGTESPLCARTKKFANRLNGRFNLPAYEHDERLTTFEAKGERMAQGGQRGSFRDNPVDAIAARLVLQSWIDEFLAKSQSKA